MPRPKKQLESQDISQDILSIGDEKSEDIKTHVPLPDGEIYKIDPASLLPKKILAKAFHMVVGVDLIGSKTSLSASKNMELEVTPLGVKAYSKSSKRTVLIPWTNIKGCELL